MPPKRFLKHEGIMKRKENESNLLLNIVLCIIVPVISNCDNMSLQNISVAFWFLDATKCCYEIDICAKLFQNPSMHDKVTVWT
jgi:hypothetical protein